MGVLLRGEQTVIIHKVVLCIPGMGFGKSNYQLHHKLMESKHAMYLHGKKPDQASSSLLARGRSSFDYIVLLVYIKVHLKMYHRNDFYNPFTDLGKII